MGGLLHVFIEKENDGVFLVSLSLPQLYEREHWVVYTPRVLSVPKPIMKPAAMTLIVPLSL